MSTRDWLSKMSLNSQNDDASSGNTYTIQGVKVRFPYKKAYPSQIIMMEKILQGLKTRRNCLLESPTGSGKTLALLCASLAWQQKETARFKEMLLKESESFLDASIETIEDDNVDEIVLLDQSTCSLNSSTTEMKVEFDDDEDDFKPGTLFKRFTYSAKKNRSIDSPNCEGGTKTTSNSAHSKPSVSTPSREGAQQQQAKDIKSERCDPPPKIYFGTRTHRQITQIIRELRKTDYRNVRMTILGSRELTCIHPEIKTSKFKNEECQDLIKTRPGCRFHIKASNPEVVHSVDSELKTCWDIENLVDYGKKVNACPYFLSHELMVTADVVFCPYNYLIDMSIRDAMKIDLSGNIVIFDEAHNMEDAARSATSFTISSEDIKSAMNDFEKAVSFGYESNKEYLMIRLFSRLSSWLLDFANSCTQWDYVEFYERHKVWSGMDFAAILATLGWGPKDFETISNIVQLLITADSTENGERSFDYLSSTKFVCRGLLLLLKFLYKKNLFYVDDFKVVLTKSSGERQFQQQRRRKSKESEIVISLKFSCMNPAVAFSEFADVVHSIVLTSGTLSPMNSFESELGVKFPIRLEANHVIDASQVWVGILGSSVDGTRLHAGYKSADAYSFQDAVGSLLLDICKKTPDGVLCFLPSYSLLDKLTNRWKDTNLWNDMLEVKSIFVEPKGSDKEDFNDIMKNFYDTVHLVTSKKNSKTGALFFAVCRGKVSEGLDFADRNARAVITIGIPFPNMKSVEVDLKKRYNNGHYKERNLLTGDQWYEIQAFRALNQALGRCIRHRNDWGALILIDERLISNHKYTEGLSKWVRNKISKFHNTAAALDSLSAFMKTSSEKFSLSSTNLVSQVAVENDALSMPSTSQHHFNKCKETNEQKYTLMGTQGCSVCVEPGATATGSKQIELDGAMISAEDQNSRAREVDMSLNTPLNANQMLDLPQLVKEHSSHEHGCWTKSLSVKRKLCTSDHNNKKKIYYHEDDDYDEVSVGCIQNTQPRDCFQGIVCGNCGSKWKADYSDVVADDSYPKILDTIGGKLKFSCSCQKGEQEGLKECHLRSTSQILRLEPKTTDLCNAIWDDETKCCYQLLVCQSCKHNAAVQLKCSSYPVAWKNDQIWFLSKSTRICPSHYFCSQASVLMNITL